MWLVPRLHLVCARVHRFTAAAPELRVSPRHGGPQPRHEQACTYTCPRGRHAHALSAHRYPGRAVAHTHMQAATSVYSGSRAITHKHNSHSPSSHAILTGCGVQSRYPKLFHSGTLRRAECSFLVPRAGPGDGARAWSSIFMDALELGAVANGGCPLGSGAGTQEPTLPSSGAHRLGRGCLPLRIGAGGPGFQEIAPGGCGPNVCRDPMGTGRPVGPKLPPATYFAAFLFGSSLNPGGQENSCLGKANWIPLGSFAECRGGTFILSTAQYPGVLGANPDPTPTYKLGDLG